MKTYHGFRDSGGTCHIEVRESGQAVGRPLTHEVRHSPTGFEWGYGGSGPADTARSLLADHLGFVPSAAVYQRFKFAVVAGMCRDRWDMTGDWIDLALAGVKTDLGVQCLRCMDRGFLWKDERTGGEDETCSCCICPAGQTAAAELGEH